MAILTNTVQEAYNQLLADSSNSLNGTWEITEDNYLSVTGQSNGSIAMFSTLGALGDFTLEWTSKQLGGSYIHSNLCPILRYTPEDLGIEGGGNNYAMILYLCSYHGDPTGTFTLRTDDGNISKEYPIVEASIDVNSIHSFKLIRSGSTLTFYEDDVLITTTTNLSSKPLYLGWYLWYGGSNSNYQTNFVLQNYRLEGVLSSIKNYVNKPGLAEIWANIKNYVTAQLLGKSNTGHTHTVSDVTDFPTLATVATSGSYNDLTNKPTIPTALESLSTNSIAFHNAYPRCKYLGTTITDAQNTAIKNRTYDDLFIGDYWTINGVNWRIVAIDYYFNVGDTNFDKGNIIVMPDTVLYNAQMNNTNTTAGAYYGSLMRTQNLNNARTIAQNAFGSHLANHRIVLANSVDTSGPNNWSWYDSDGVELPNEVQIYGTRVWGSALKGYDVATQKQQFPLMLLAPQFVNTRQNYWLQDVSSYSVSSYFALVHFDGYANNFNASYSNGVRPSVTLSYI